MKLFQLLGLLIVAVLFTTFQGTATAQSVQDFYFERFHADYYLSIDEDDRAIMRVEETIVARFPDFNQNKGIVREIPRSYRGVPLQLELISLERNNQPEPIYDDTNSGRYRIISTGTDDFITGQQTFTFTYTVRDVIRDYDTHQELFWDVNGTGWRQRFDSVSSTLYVSDDLVGTLDGQVTCFQGSFGATNQCDIIDNQSNITFSATRALQLGETLSIVVGFEPDTFAPHEEGFAGTLRAFAAGGATILSILGLQSVLRFRRKHLDVPGRGVTVRQYIPPKGISVMRAAHIHGNTRWKQKSITAQLLELAIQRHIKIIETEKSGFWSRGVQYDIEIIDTSSLSDEAKRLLEALFKSDYKVGDRIQLNQTMTKRASHLATLQRALPATIVKKGYRRKASGSIKPIMLSLVAVSLATIIWIQRGAVGYQLDFAGDWRLWPLPLAAIIFVITIFITARHSRPLTQSGREMHDYLEGMREYIGLAEAERLQFAQSPTGAQRQRVNTKDTEAVIRLYERLLPYAVLFGHEKEWFKELGTYYEKQHQAPVWFAGTQAFSASTFASGMSALSTTAASSSSGSGFSGGGGAGGGGGGGGGGGR